MDMWKVILSAALFSGGAVLPAATVQLKDQASVSGTILAQKPDEVVIDIGYTVLVIPLSQILHLLNDSAPDAKAPAAAKPAAVRIRPAPAASGPIL